MQIQSMNGINLYLSNQQLHQRMSIEANNFHYTTQTTPLKLRHNKLISRKALPLPILSLQTKQAQSPQRYSRKINTQNKSPIRQHFKRIIQILDQSKKKTSSIPANFQNQVHSRDTQHSKQILGRHIRRTNHLLLKTHLINTMQKIYNSKTLRSQQQSPIQLSKQRIPSLHRTVTNKNKSKKQQDSTQQKFMKWQSFCTSISYQHKTTNNLPSLQLKKKYRKRIYLKKRSESSLSNGDQDVNGWQNMPVRHLTDYDNNDFSDIY